MCKSLGVSKIIDSIKKWTLRVIEVVSIDEARLFDHRLELTVTVLTWEANLVFLDG